MRKKLIAALIAVCILLAAAVGVLIYMENKPSQQPDDGTEPETTAAVDDTSSDPVETTEVIETTEETVGISLPTEDPDTAAPEETFGEEDVLPPATVDPEIPATTEDPDANETPEDVF